MVVMVLLWLLRFIWKMIFCILVCVGFEVWSVVDGGGREGNQVCGLSMLGSWVFSLVLFSGVWMKLCCLLFGLMIIRLLLWLMVQLGLLVLVGMQGMFMVLVSFWMFFGVLVSFWKLVLKQFRYCLICCGVLWFGLMLMNIICRLLCIFCGSLFCNLWSWVRVVGQILGQKVQLKNSRC